MNVQPFQTYVLDSYVRIGDRVAVLIDRETRAWRNKQYEHLPDGKEGVVIGFNRYKKYVNRNQVFKDKPGEYMSNGLAIVKWDDGGNDSMSAHHIGPMYQGVIESRRDDKAYKEAFDTDTYMKPLPELPYWEGDIVRTNECIFNRFGEDQENLVITGIDYYRIGDFCNDGITPMPIYHVRIAGIKDSPMMMIRERDIVELVERGNYWKLEHGEELSFKDINEKLNFYGSIGETEQVRNPKTDTYRWTMEDIVEAVEAKTIDFCLVSSNVFGTTPMLNAYRIPNHPDVAEEARSHFQIKDFK